MEKILLTKELLIEIHEAIHNLNNKPGDIISLQGGIIKAEMYLRVNGCRAIDVGEFAFMNQNLFSKSLYAQQAKSGYQITWGVRGRGDWAFIRKDRRHDFVDITDGYKSLL